MIREAELERHGHGLASASQPTIDSHDAYAGLPRRNPTRYHSRWLPRSQRRA